MILTLRGTGGLTFGAATAGTTTTATTTLKIAVTTLTSFATFGISAFGISAFATTFIEARVATVFRQGAEIVLNGTGFGARRFHFPRCTASASFASFTHGRFGIDSRREEFFRIEPKRLGDLFGFGTAN